MWYRLFILTNTNNMIRTIVVCLVVALLFSTCKKSNSDNSTTIVEYQVTTTNSSNLDITYNNILGNKIPASAQNSWVFDIKGPTKPFTAYIQASSSSPFTSVTTTCTVNILVNGSVAKTTTVSSNTVAVAEAEYIVQ
jgi:hypothetical protein